MIPTTDDRRPTTAVSGPVLILGVSARGMAESAVRAGYTVAAVDAYADLDLAEIADTHLISPYSVDAVIRAARGLPSGRPVPGPTRIAGPASASGPLSIWSYVSNLENYPEAIRRLGRGRVLWGNSPRTLAAVRSPGRIARVLGAAGLAVPAVRATAPRAGSAGRGLPWLLKPRASGGGHGIRAWRPGIPVPRRAVLQQRISGPAGSLTFVADGERCLPIALTRQLIGDRRFGAKPFRYCGNLLAPAGDPRWGIGTPLWSACAAVASIATRAFNLVGVNGLDFIARGANPVPLEVNPRFTASMELAERRDGLSVFAAHAAACQGTLHRVAIPDPAPGASGKALVFARNTLTSGDTTRWLSDPDIRDIPRPETSIPAGAPICTVFAASTTLADCERQLVAKANEIYRAVASWG